MPEIENILEKIGFKNKKARAYRALLELGRASAQEIAKKANVERTSIYALLDSLEKDGLIISTIKKKRKCFVPLPPQKLTDFLKEKSNLAEKALPLFLSIYNSSDIKPKIRFYESKEGIKEVFNDTLSSKEKLLRNLSSAKDILELLGKDFLSHYIEKRVKKKIKLRSLRPKSKEADNWYLRAENKQVLRTARFLPKEIIFNVVCIIYDNKVAVISSKKEGFGFIIESKEFSDLMKTLYDLTWQTSKPVI